MDCHNFIGHAVFVVSVLLTVSIVLLSKTFGKIRQRRSPLRGKQIEHVPGQQLLERIDKESEEAGFGVDAMILALPCCSSSATTPWRWCQ